MENVTVLSLSALFCGFAILNENNDENWKFCRTFRHNYNAPALILIIDGTLLFSVFIHPHVNSKVVAD